MYRPTIKYIFDEKLVFSFSHKCNPAATSANQPELDTLEFPVFYQGQINKYLPTVCPAFILSYLSSLLPACPRKLRPPQQISHIRQQVSTLAHSTTSNRQGAL